MEINFKEAKNAEFMQKFVQPATFRANPRRRRWHKQIIFYDYENWS